MTSQPFFFGTLWRQGDYVEGPCVHVILISASPSAPIHHLFHTVTFDVTLLYRLRCNFAFTCFNHLKYS